jgi:acyl transferase domain-containing protein/acyl carrier protein
MDHAGTFNHQTGFEIAIIGIAGRFPGAKNIDEFWQNLRDGVESISFFSDEELVASNIDSETLSDPNYVKAGGVIEDAEFFDAQFFGFTPMEAQTMDPQHRIFLECAWEALEDAGYDAEKYTGSIGIYAGVAVNTYLVNNLISNHNLIESLDELSTTIAIDKDFLTTRVSYKLNLKGPAIVVQTACSTSLVAVHLACQSLLSGECDIALGGGVSIKVPQKRGYNYQEGGIGSPDGHCKAFDADARGTVGGNGVGIVVLKRLSDALASGDHIYTVIKGSAINNDGSLKVGYTAPGVEGQAEAIKKALAMAEVLPETVSYIEAHGTGTALGDAVEIAALTQAFRASTNKKGFCAIGSVKTNIGHLNTAAGVASLIKTALLLKHRELPPSLHFTEPNSKIDFANSPFFVNNTLSEWKVSKYPRRAGVSSFGIGGTNAHVVLEEAPVKEPAAPSRPWQLLLLSAKTETALETATKNLVEHLKNQPDLNLADAAYTLQVGRREFSKRRVVVCQNVDDALNALDTADPKRVFTALADMDDRPVVFMFSGQGSQYVNMGLELYRVEAAFREQIDFCAEILKPHLGLDLRDVLYPDEKRIDEATRRLTQTSMTQPALFAIEYALAKLLAEWGIRPRAMIGHSIGEYVAACLSGVFSLKDALALVATRGRLMQTLPAGAMLAVPLPEAKVSPLLGKQLSLAATNGPSLCVVSGPTEAVAELKSRLTAQNVSCRHLHTSHAFHSEMMEPILEPFIQQVRKSTLNPPRAPFVSNVTGRWITTAEATDPGYWAKHLRQTVCFAQGAEALLKEPGSVLLEIGPGNTLSSLIRQHPARSSDQVVLTSLHHPRDHHPDTAFLLNTLGRLWLAGVKIDWAGFYAREKRHRIPLPTYPFERQRYWVEPQTQASPVKAVIGTLGKKPDIADWFYIPSWKRTTPLGLDNLDILNQKELSWLIFIDEYGVGATTANCLKQAGQHVVSVTVGEKFTKVDDGFYSINPQTPDDYGELLRELRVLNNVPNNILHFWCITPNERRDLGFELVERYQYLGFYSLLFIAQGLGKHCVDNFIQISVFSNNMRDVTGGELVCPEKATLSGACKIIPQEYQNIKCRSIDLSIPVSDTQQQDKMINQIIYETIDLSSDTVVAYRGDYRWVETFEPVRLDKTAEMTPRLKERGTYLITGGLGGMGFALAEHLAKTLSANLILTGRSYFPAKDEWEQWLANHDDKDSTSQKIRKIQELEKLGAEFLIVSADVADLEQMQTVISKSEDIFGKINGVVHSAGIIDHGGVIQRRSLEKTAEVLASKVTGTLVLNTVLSDAELDFFVCCSSMGTVLYKLLFGEVGYCAANEFLDAFGYYRFSRNGSFSVTINWCGWSEVGMAVRAIDYFSEVYGVKRESTAAVSPSEGVDIFLRIIGGEHHRVAVWPQELGIAIEHEKSFLDIAPSLESAKPSHSRPDLPTPYATPRNAQEQEIAEIWQNLLGIEQVGIHDNFFELGGHSLLATQIISRLRDTFQVELQLHQIFEIQTIAGLSESIEKVKNSGSKLQAPAISPISRKSRTRLPE